MTAIDDEKETALVYSKLMSFRNRVAKTEAFIKDALRQVKSPYIACSFGKDSAVLVDLVLKCNPETPVVFFSRGETYLVDDYVRVINEWKTRGAFNLVEVVYEGWLEQGDSTQSLSKVARDFEGYDSFFVGLRAEESVGRRITLRKDGLFYQMKNGKKRIAPLGFWNIDDIAAYTFSRDLPLLSKYMAEGITARTTAGVARRFPQESLQSLKQRDISAYNTLLAKFPDARHYT